MRAKEYPIPPALDLVFPPFRLDLGRVEEAYACADRLLDLSRTHTGCGYQAHAYRLLGDVTMRREPPDVEEATAHYHQALTVAEEVGMRPLLAHCHRGLGTLYAQMRQREAVQLACNFRGIFVLAKSTSLGKGERHWAYRALSALRVVMVVVSRCLATLSDRSP